MQTDTQSTIISTIIAMLDISEKIESMGAKEWLAAQLTYIIKGDTNPNDVHELIELNYARYTAIITVAKTINDYEMTGY